ncbi:MAG: hypothetical protein U9Q07_02425 [Planctomycetota bacterium]|nr:hypothetical protein [Planctomycetota bacterium]
MIFINLVRVLGAGLAAGLICHLLYSAGKKNMTTRPRGQDGKEHRKYVESSIIEKKDETSDQENS